MTLNWNLSFRAFGNRIEGCAAVEVSERPDLQSSKANEKAVVLELAIKAVCLLRSSPQML